MGRPYTRTQVFQEMLSYVELNPYWTVPYSISSREILPKLKSDPGYLSRNNMKIFNGGKSFDPYSVDWSMVSRGNFPYVIRQEPGDKNALGRMKFMFPNRYNIYLHDTPSKSKFELDYRAWSHGCVRLHEPHELAYYLFKDDKKWNKEKIDNTLAKRKNKRINLEKPIPIYILYITNSTDANGKLIFHTDVYKRDSRIASALSSSKTARYY